MPLISPAFPEFRRWLHEAVDRQKVHDMIEGSNFVFFFKRGKEVFGAPEESRLTFAKIKNPDEDLPSGWTEEATFMALNLSKAIQGEMVRSIFRKKDLKEITIMDKDEAIKKVSDEAVNLPHNKKKLDGKIHVVFKDRKPEHPDKATNMKKLGEK